MSVRWRAPGRVNLIGEHTDYNGGFALPFAIEAGCVADVARVDEPGLLVRSAQRDEPVRLGWDELAPGAGDWATYVAGVVWALREHGVPMGDDGGGLSIAIDSSVPSGSGLSSSAAVVCSVTTALDDLLTAKLSDGDVLDVSRRAENDYVGAPTGGMDQLASLRCTEAHALFCDMRSLEVEQVPLDLAAGALSLLVVDTRTAHRHADGEYARRRAGCEQAAELLGVDLLREIGLADLAVALAKLEDGELQRYVRHVVTEDARVLETVRILQAGADVRDIGPLLSDSHASMRDDYRITTPELDTAVDTMVLVGAHGARMTGGGFGGCAIGLVEAADADATADAVVRAFAEHGFAEPSVLPASPGPGAHRL